MNAPGNDRTAAPSPAEGEGAHEAAMLDTVERLGPWRTNAKYRIGVAHRLTGVSAIQSSGGFGNTRPMY